MSFFLFAISLINIAFAIMDFSHGDIFRVMFDAFCGIIIWDWAQAKMQQEKTQEQIEKYMKAKHDA